MSYRLEITVLSGVSAGDIFRFDVDNTHPVAIGRAQDNDLVLGDSTVSRNHAAIYFRDNQFRLIDCGSSHGTVHMGFRLEPGEVGARTLGSGDEFKIGDAIFRVEYDEDALPQPVQEADAGAAAQGGAGGRNLLANKKLVGLVVVAAILGLAFMFAPGGKKGLPKQLHKRVMNIPQLRVVGYYGAGQKLPKNRKDVRHLNYAQFYLPASDLLLEYDFRSESKVQVRFNDIEIEQLEPNPDYWLHRQTIVRDPLIGEERRLIFDNLDYPRKKGKKKKGRLKQWGVYNVRTTPLTRQLEGDTNAAMRAAVGLTERLDKSPDALFAVLRAVQRAILQTIVEMNLDAIGFDSPIDAPFPPAQEIKDNLSGILRERKDVFTQIPSETLARHLQVLTRLSGTLDAELWRRVKNRFTKARLASEADNFIDAHDHLIAAKSMVPDETDERWRLADAMFNNKKIVPKKVRDKPAKYRKSRMKRGGRFQR